MVVEAIRRQASHRTSSNHRNGDAAVELLGLVHLEPCDEALDRVVVAAEAEAVYSRQLVRLSATCKGEAACHDADNAEKQAHRR